MEQSFQSEAVQRFVEAWGSMGDLFGFNPSTARVSALLIVSGETLSLGEIADALQISRGNASMCLKELRGWGVVRQVQRPGDRRDHYTSERDLWRMFVAIARERKRREFDPALGGALAALEELHRAEAGPPAEWLDEIEEFLRTLDRFGKQFLENEQAALSLVTLLRAGLGGSKE
jgi:DNA-binding transcriptional regulator GbsR (MarR family)